MTYYLMISLAPLALGLTGLAAILLGDYHAAQEAARSYAANLPDDLRQDIVSLVVGTNRSSPHLIAAGIVVMTWTCTGAINVLERSLSRLLDRPRLRLGKRVGRQLLASLGVALTLFASAAVSTVGVGISEQFPNAQFLVAWWSPATTAATAFIVCLCLMRFLPSGGMRLRNAALGALPATACLIVIPQIIAMFIKASDLRAARVFFDLAVVLLGCNLLAQGLLIGAGLAAQSELRARGLRVRLPQAAPSGKGLHKPHVVSETSRDRPHLNDDPEITSTQ
jgi:uncharacterized BrkB/YihY/UPF0761 family membrane protein